MLEKKIFKSYIWMMISFRYDGFSTTKLYILIYYQNQEAVVANNILPPIPYPLSYLPAGQPFLEANIQYMNLGILAVICSYCYALHFDCEKLVSLWINHSKFGMCYLQGQI